jgi:large subunit ribosomal protein L14
MFAARALGSLFTAPRGARAMSIHLKTCLNVIDNSGAREVECIDFFRHNNSRTGVAKIGDPIRVVVKSARPDARVSKKDIVAAVIVRQRARHQRKDGSTVHFQENAAVLMKRDLSGPIGTRVTGPVARELREGRFMKIVLMASRVL